MVLIKWFDSSSCERLISNMIEEKSLQQKEFIWKKKHFIIHQSSFRNEIGHTHIFYIHIQLLLELVIDLEV